MVRFLNPARPTDEAMTIWCEPVHDGYRLVRRDPGGTLHAERFVDRTALADATVRWQRELTRAGWRPDPRRAASHHAARARQFHR